MKTQHLHLISSAVLATVLVSCTAGPALQAGGPVATRTPSAGTRLEAHFSFCACGFDYLDARMENPGSAVVLGTFGPVVSLMCSLAWTHDHATPRRAAHRCG